ncbi:MAG: GspH/FimT family pseudopilin [Rubrivivax sp.]
MQRSPSLMHRQLGLTLVECTVTLAVTSVVAGIAAPNFQQLRERKAVESVAASIETDFAYTRSLAVAQNRTLRVNFADARCYVVHTGPATNCSCHADGSASCSGNPDVLKVVQLAAATPVTLSSNSKSIAFDAMKGTVTPTATVKIAGAGGGATLHNVVNIMGRMRSCAPAPGLPGHARC